MMRTGVGLGVWIIILLGLLVSESCGGGESGSPIYHLPGKHDAIQPPNFERGPDARKVEFRFKFTDENKYDIEDSNQGDFNKLTGIQHYYFNPHRSTCMIGWRWFGGNLTVTPYIHTRDHDLSSDGWIDVGAYVGWINSNYFRNLDLDKDYVVTMEDDGSNFLIVSEDLDWNITIPHSGGTEALSRTRTWFGGQETIELHEDGWKYERMDLVLNWTWL